MVFCGRPSKGCSGCRKRRIKCDLLEPSCSQCIRADKKCEGYRDQQSLMFRDENAITVRKAHKVPIRPGKRTLESPNGQSSEKNTKSSPQTTWDEELAVTLQFEPPTQPTNREISFPRVSTPHEDKGIAFFFTHYVMITSSANGRVTSGTSDFWPQLWTDRLVFNAVSSVGLAALSNVTKDESLMVVARHKYLEIMRYVGKALENLDEVNLDNTLKAVMMLAIFEMVNCTPQTTGTWGVHIEGAANLLRLIKKKAIPGCSSRMHLQLCFAVLVRYFQSGKNLPLELIEWSRNCGKAPNNSDLPAFILVGIVSTFIDLHASIRSGDLTDPETIIQKALLCDAKLEEWEAELPEMWKFETVTGTGAEENLFQGEYQVYRDLWSCRIWNHYRWTRILVNELIVAHLAIVSPFPPEFVGRHDISMSIILRMAGDICSSVVAQFIRHNPSDANALFVPHLSGVFLLLFPLAVAGGSIGVSEELHNWVINLLEKIGNKMGVQQALTLIPLTKKHRERKFTGKLWPRDPEA